MTTRRPCSRGHRRPFTTRAGARLCADCGVELPRLEPHDDPTPAEAALERRRPIETIEAEL